MRPLIRPRCTGAQLARISGDGRFLITRKHGVLQDVGLLRSVGLRLSPEAGVLAQTSSPKTACDEQIRRCGLFAVGDCMAGP
jgi:hypothetical protein